MTYLAQRENLDFRAVWTVLIEPRQGDVMCQIAGLRNSSDPLYLAESGLRREEVPG